MKKEKQFVLICPRCGKLIQFFFRESAEAYGKSCPQCFSQLRLRVVSGVPDPKTGYVTVDVTDCYTSTVTPKSFDT